MNEKLAALIGDLRSEDENIRKTATNKIASMDFSLIDKNMLPELIAALNEVAQDPNLTIRYFAKKALKSLGAKYDIDKIAKQAFSPKPAKSEEPESVQSSEKPVRPTKPCSKCGHENPESVKFCTKCGQPMFEATELMEKVKEEQQEKTVSEIEEAPPISEEPVAEPISETTIVPQTEAPAPKIQPEPKPKKSRIPKSKPIVVSKTARKTPLFYTIINILLSIALLCVHGYAIYEKTKLLGVKEALMKNLTTQILAGGLLLWLLVFIFAFKKLTSAGTLKYLFLLLIGIIGYDYYRVTIENPQNLLQYYSIYGKDVKICANFVFPLIFISSIFIIWSNGSKFKPIKIILTIVALYSLASFIMPLIHLQPFDPDLFDLDRKFVESVKWLEFMRPLYFVQPIFVGVNYLLPLIGIYLLLFRFLPALFTGKFLKLIGVILAFAIIGSGTVAGVFLFEREGFIVAKQQGLPRNLFTAWDFVFWSKDKINELINKKFKSTKSSKKVSNSAESPKESSKITPESKEKPESTKMFTGESQPSSNN